VTLVVAYWLRSQHSISGGRFSGHPMISRKAITCYWIPLDTSAPYWAAFLAAIMVAALLGLFVMAYQFHRASLAESDARVRGFLL
jgi:hypothetical protein